MKHLAARLGFRLSALAVISLFSIATLLGIGASVSRSYAESEKMGAAQAMGREKQRAQIRSERGGRALSGNHSLGASLPLSPVPVVSITVDRTDDTSAASLCTAAANDCSLRGAVAFANSVPGTTIIVPAGTYNLTISGGVTTVQGSGEGFAGNNSIGDLDVTQSNTSIVGAGAASTVIDQTSSANDRVIETNPFLASGFVFSISGVTIKGGNTPDGGGGIVTGSFNNSTTISNCVFDDNHTIGNSSPGGAIWNVGGTLNVSSCTFTGNSSANSAGGAIAMDNLDPGDLTITGSSFINNTTGANSSGGGAIAFSGLGGTHNISTSSFAGNQATHPSGGGGAIFSSNSGGTLNVRYSRFFNNTATQPVQGNTLSRSGGSFTANDNWWGVNTGPGANDVSGAITRASWLQLRISANPDTICPNATSTLTADILGRNTGTPANASDLAGLPPFPATFSTAPPNTVSPTTTDMVNGQATSTFTAVNAVSSSADADVTADNETETVTITINHTTASALVNEDACPGQSASFSTTAGGTGPFTFVWKKGATTLNNGDLGGRVTITSAGNASTLTISGVVGTDAATYTVEVTTACETVTQSATLSVDPTAPTITAPADMDYQCASSVPAANPSQATSADNCGTPTVTVSESNNNGAGTTASPLIITRTYTATDANGNSASDSQTITVIDNTAPTVTAPAASSASADANCQAAIPDVVAGSSASDNCGGTVTLTQSPAAGTLVGIGPPHTITVTATDAAGNTSSDTTTFTVNDTTAPVVSAPANAAYQCASNVPAANASQASASDNCGTPTVTVTETNNGGAGTTASPLVITRTYTATDGSSNSASGSQTITVIDNTAPTVTAPADSSAAADAACQAAIPNVIPGSSSSDNCGGTVTLTQSPAAGTLVGVGPHTITVTATDAAGNTSSDTTTFTVTDATAPTLTLNGPNPMTVECHTGFTDPGASANDACAGNLTGSIVVTGSVDPNTVGSYTLTYTVSDGVNTTSKSRVVNVVDTTAPIITLNGPNPLTVSCQASFSDPGATANDSCAGSGQATASSNVNVNVPGTYTITYTASDASGNAATPVTRTVIVADTGAPVINLSSTPISFWPPNHSYQTVNVSSIVTSVSDACGGGGSLTVNDVVITKVTSDETENGNGDGNTLNDIIIAASCKSVQLRSERDGSGNGRVYTIHLKVTDGAGNTGTATFKVTVPKNQGGTAIDNGPAYTKMSSCQ